MEASFVALASTAWRHHTSHNVMQPNQCSVVMSKQVVNTLTYRMPPPPHPHCLLNNTQDNVVGYKFS